MESWIEVIDGYKVSNLGEVYSTRTNTDIIVIMAAERMFCPKQLYKKP